MFQQQAAIDPGLQWNVIHPQLQATTILGQGRASQGSFCHMCQECDHATSQCALMHLQQGMMRGPPSLSRQANRPPQCICGSWNNGECIFPETCNCRHICSNCRQPTHPARDCQLPPRPRFGTGQATTSASASRSSS